MLADITLSSHTARLFKHLKDGRISEYTLKDRFQNISYRLEAVLGAIYTHYFLWVTDHGNQAYLLTPWGEEPNFNGWAPPPSHLNFQSSPQSPTSAALTDLSRSTTDPHSLVSMLAKPSVDTLKDILHPTFQRQWYEHLKSAEAKQEFRSKDPKVQYYLTRQGQMEFFVLKALDGDNSTADQLRAMRMAGELKGYYSEKIQLMHENAPTTNVQQNFIMGTELTNRFRLFMESKMKQRQEQLEAPDHTEEEIIDVEPELPDFLQMANA